MIAIWGDRLFWAHMSLWLIAFGVIAALLAAVFGFTDYFSASSSVMPPRFFVRYGDATSVLGYVLTYVALALLVVSGWYGGLVTFTTAGPREGPRSHFRTMRL